MVYFMYMTDDQFTKLFKYVQDFRTEVIAKLDEKASQGSIDTLINTLDGFVKRVEDA
jgi:hypothetical protein